MRKPLMLLIVLLALGGATVAVASKGVLSGRIVELMNSGGYSYLLLDTGEPKKRWVALPFTADLMIGEVVQAEYGTDLTNFVSKSLHKSFESIMFSPGLVAGTPESSQTYETLLEKMKKEPLKSEVTTGDRSKVAKKETPAPVARDEAAGTEADADDVESPVPQGVKAGKYDIAVIIGNRDYAPSGVPDVEYALRDARAVKQYVVTTLGYDSRNVLYVEDATMSKFFELFGSERDAKGRLYNYVKPGESQVFIYYVGHGAPDLETNEAYFVPVDANPQYIKANGYRLQTFYDNLAKLPAKRITVVLDSCFSGNSEKGMLFKNVSPALLKVKKDVAGPANAVVMTSAGLDQVSTWYPEKRHSLFTYYFLKGLQGEADPEHTGKITVGALEKYLKENVPYMARRLSGNEQQPLVSGNENQVMAVISHPSR